VSTQFFSGAEVVEQEQHHGDQVSDEAEDVEGVDQ